MHGLLYGWIKLKAPSFTLEVRIDIDSYACNAGLAQHTKSSKELIRIVDLMCRELKDVPNVPLIEWYSDGIVESVY